MPAKTKPSPRKARTTAKPRKTSKATKMPKFKPAPEWIKELFANVISYFPEAEPRKMFGYPCAFVRGHMFAGVFADRLMLRLSDEDRAKFLNMPGAKQFEPMPGRPMKEYVEAPPDMVKSEAELKKWIQRGLVYTKTLPPKEKKK